MIQSWAVTLVAMLAGQAPGPQLPEPPPPPGVSPAGDNRPSPLPAQTATPPQPAPDPPAPSPEMPKGARDPGLPPPAGRQDSIVTVDWSGPSAAQVGQWADYTVRV